MEEREKDNFSFQMLMNQLAPKVQLYFARISRIKIFSKYKCWTYDNNFIYAEDVNELKAV